MNNTRRKQLEALIERIEVIKEELEVLKDEEQEYYDNMPDAFRDGEKGEKASQIIDALDCAYLNLADVPDYIQEAIEQ